MTMKKINHIYKTLSMLVTAIYLCFRFKGSGTNIVMDIFFTTLLVTRLLSLDSIDALFAAQLDGMW